MIKEVNLVGICIIAYIKSSLAKEVKGLDSLIVKTGILGITGNKGSCVIRFDLFKTSFAFSNGHFASGEEMHNERVKELVDIMSKNVRENNYSSKESCLIDHDVAFIFGDLNFRVDVENTRCRSMIKSGDISSLLKKDQFISEKKRNPNFEELEEGEITFNPTFKFDANSDEYDTSKKKRIPSWTDRILWKRSNLVKQMAYNSVNYKISDHRPVYGHFVIRVPDSNKDLSDDVNFKKEKPKSHLKEKDTKSSSPVRLVEKKNVVHDDTLFQMKNPIKFDDYERMIENYNHNKNQLKHAKFLEDDNFVGHVVNNKNLLCSIILF